MTEKKTLKQKYKKIVKIGIFFAILLVLVYVVVKIRFSLLKTSVNGRSAGKEFATDLRKTQKTIDKDLVSDLETKERFLENRIKNLESNIVNSEKTQKIIDEDLILNIKAREQFLENRIKNLENNLLLLQANLENAQLNIMKLENTSPATGERTLQMVVLLYKIKDVVNFGGDFNVHLEHLKKLAKNKDFIYDNIGKLEKYGLQKTQLELKNVFFEEYIKLNSNRDIGNKISDKIKYFLAENIKIRRISNFAENVDNTSLNIAKIENSIDKHDYNDAIKIITENDYNSIFINTLNILQEKQEILDILNDVLDSLYEIKEF